MDDSIASDFSSIPEIGSISNNKIYLKSTYLDIFFIPFIAVLVISLIFYNYNGLNNLVINSILIGILIFGSILLLNLNENYVIDFDNSKIYKEFFLLGIPFRTNIIPLNEISQIANNVKPIRANPGGEFGTIGNQKVERNAKTQYYHEYYFDCLSKTGKLISIHFGYFIENYHHSINFGKLLSEKWNIPFVECPECSTLKIEKDINGYSLKPEEIKEITIPSHLGLYVFLTIVFSTILIILLIMLLSIPSKP